MICELCPRRCGTDRAKAVGFCGVGEEIKIARAALHHWEEPCISGTKGSGTVFFSGCILRCVFCQNREISTKAFGKEIPASRLRKIFEELIEKGAHNINLVSPTQFTPWILKALEQPLSVPVVWNTGGYERLETLRQLKGKVQIYLPDLKYVSSEMSKKYSGAADYFAVTSQAILEMYRQVGAYQMGENGLLKSGVIIRHMMMPGGLADTKRVIDWVAEHFAYGQVLFSLMSQYTPIAGVPKEIARHVTKSEYNAACAYMENCGLTEGFQQERCAAKEEYTPPFDLTGV